MERRISLARKSFKKKKIPGSNIVASVFNGICQHGLVVQTCFRLRVDSQCINVTTYFCTVFSNANVAMVTGYWVDYDDGSHLGVSVRRVH